MCACSCISTVFCPYSSTRSFFFSFCVYKVSNDKEFKSQEMITGPERPGISSTMGAEKYSLLWWRPFPGFKYQVQVSRTLSQVLGLEDLGPKPKAKLIVNLAGDNIRGERWWLVRLPSAGINNSSLSVSHQSNIQQHLSPSPTNW